MTLALTFLTSTDSQSFTGYSCDDGETLLQIPVSTDKDTARSEAIAALMTEVCSLSDDVAQGYTDDQIKACFTTAINATSLVNVYVNAVELGVDLDADPECFDDLYSYWVLNVTYDVHLTYDLVLNNDTDNNGEADDNGFFMVDCGGAAHGENEDSIANPLGLDVYSFPANGYKSPEESVTHALTIDQVQTLYNAASWYIDGEYITDEDAFIAAVAQLDSYPSIYSGAVKDSVYSDAETTFGIHQAK